MNLNQKINPMTPLYTRKLQQALIDIGHQVEKDTATPAISDIEVLFDKFLQSVDSEDPSKQKKAIDKLLSGLVKWEVEKL